jgi:opacity protein-like surface antigen
MLNQFISGRSLVAGVGLLATFLLPAFAWADGFYADLHGGATFFNNDAARVNNDAARVTRLTSGGSVHAHTNYDTGWLAGSSAGYEWKQGFAGEFEFTFRQNHLNRIASSAPLFVGGDLHSFAMMFNGYYRFHNATPFTPYLGGGLGEAVVGLNNARPTAGVDRGPFGGTDAAFAYQGIAGVSYPLAPHLSIAAEYRYFASLRPGFQQQLAGQEVKVSPSYDSHNALLRLVYSLK